MFIHRWSSSFTIAVLCLGHAAPSPAAIVNRLLFWDSADTFSESGSITFDANILNQNYNTTGYPSTYQGSAVPNGNGGVYQYSWNRTGSAGNYNVQVTRSTTSDGLAFTGDLNQSVTQQNSVAFAQVVHRPTDNSMFLFSYTGYPATLQVWKKPGTSAATPWNYLGNAYSNAHDANNIIWDPKSQRFLDYQTVLVSYPQKNPDDNFPNQRRVLSLKSSSDGLNWQNELLNGGTTWQPDGSDSAQLEFYRAVAFEHQGRYAMLIRDYQANPAFPGQHAPPPQAAEWAYSNDGKNWSRNFRNLNVLANVNDYMPTQGPLNLGDYLRFHNNIAPTQNMTMAKDRIFSVATTTDSNFTTVNFKMPPTGLFLNADVNNGAGNYFKADLLNSSGQVLTGFSQASFNTITNQDSNSMAMLWNGNNGSSFAGQTVGLRIYFKNANIYGVDYADRSTGIVNPAAYWRFEEASGQALDTGLTPQQNGTLYGGVTRTSASLPNTTIPRTLVSNTKSVNFNGALGTAIGMGTSSDLDVGAQDFTLEAWIKPLSVTNNSVIAGKLISGLYGDTGYDLHVRPLGDDPSATTYSVKFEVRDLDGGGNDGGAGFSITAGDLALDQWRHVAGVRKDKNLILYIDGIEVGSTELSGIANFSNSGQEFAIGAGRQGGGGFERNFNGWIDEVRLTKYGLNPAQFLNAPHQPEPTSALLAVIAVLIVGAGSRTRAAGRPTRHAE